MKWKHQIKTNSKSKQEIRNNSEFDFCSGIRYQGFAVDFIYYRGVMLVIHPAFCYIRQKSANR